MPERFLCLHGHFYQPPRENPWVERIEVQDSASPFHDWNERIAAECYGPNGAARLLSSDRRITDIVDNYLGLSFDFGPTLLSWLEHAAPEIYRLVIDADQRSAAGSDGHGNGIAGAYNHVILPLATRRDRLTQIRWGRRDFEHRFGREPEGLWLPETAIDVETLQLLAGEGFRFTVLSPYQALQVREGNGSWRDATSGRLDPTQPYRCRLPGGGDIAIFFYDGPIARKMAFGGALDDAGALVDAILNGFDAARGRDELLGVAVDGETFGHHRKGGDEVLAVALERLRRDEGIRLTSYGAFLASHPATAEVEIHELTSWSCEHGVERWRSDCGCRGEGPPGWRQGWRGPLRAALDQLRDALSDLFEREGRGLLRDPWAARDDYVRLILDRSEPAVRGFFERHRARTLEKLDRARALTLLEMQRNALLMYTSCGWFFTELSGLETVQNLAYAARALQLAAELGDASFEEPFLAALAQAKGNVPEMPDGAAVYDRLVRPSIVTLPRVVAQQALQRAVAAPPGENAAPAPTPSPAFGSEILSERRETNGPASLTLGRMRLVSLATQSELDASYAVLQFGAHDLRCAVRPFIDAASSAELERVLFEKLAGFSVTEVVHALDRAFASSDFSLRDLFLDERRNVARKLLRETLARYRADYVQIYEDSRKLIQFLLELQSPIPPPLRAAAQVALGGEVDDAVDRLLDRPEVPALQAQLLRIVREAASVGAAIDLAPLREALRSLLLNRMRGLAMGRRAETAREIIELIDLAEGLSLHLDLWLVQNLFWDFSRRAALDMDPDLLLRLGERLYFDGRSLDERLRRHRWASAEVAAAAVPW